MWGGVAQQFIAVQTYHSMGVGTRLHDSCLLECTGMPSLAHPIPLYVEILDKQEQYVSHLNCYARKLQYHHYWVLQILHLGSCWWNIELWDFFLTPTPLFFFQFVASMLRVWWINSMAIVYLAMYVTAFYNLIVWKFHFLKFGYLFILLSAFYSLTWFSLVHL